MESVVNPRVEQDIAGRVNSLGKAEDIGYVIGIVVHRGIKSWDLGLKVQSMSPCISMHCNRSLGSLNVPNQVGVTESAGYA